MVPSRSSAAPDSRTVTKRPNVEITRVTSAMILHILPPLQMRTLDWIVLVFTASVVTFFLGFHIGNGSIEDGFLVHREHPPQGVEEPASCLTERVDAHCARGLGSKPKDWSSVMQLFAQNLYDDGTGTICSFADEIDRSVCRCCGSMENLTVHHIRECPEGSPEWFDFNNMVTLCEQHRFSIGHKDPKTGAIGWQFRNPNVCEDCPNRFYVSPQGVVFDRLK